MAIPVAARSKAWLCSRSPVETVGSNPAWGHGYLPLVNFCTMVTGSFPGVKSGRGVMLTLHPLLVLWSWKSRAIPLLPLWAVRPVQSSSTCTRVHFILPFSYSKFAHVYRLYQNIPVSNIKKIPSAVLEFILTYKQTDGWNNLNTRSKLT